MHTIISEAKIFRAYSEEDNTKYIDFPLFINVQNVAVSEVVENLAEAEATSVYTFYNITEFFQGRISSNYAPTFYGMPLEYTFEDALAYYNIPNTNGEHYFWFDEDKKYGFSLYISGTSFSYGNVVINGIRYTYNLGNLFIKSSTNIGRTFLGIVGGLDSTPSSVPISTSYFTVTGSPSNYQLNFVQYKDVTTAAFRYLVRAILESGASPYVPPTDPYDPASGGPGYSGPGGGPAPSGGTGTTGTGGLHDDSSDAIPTPNTPSDVVISSGLFTAYNPSASQLASFANTLWNMQVSDINDVLRFLFGGDAFNAVIGLHLLPISPSTGSSQNIKLGNWDTGVSAPKISSQYAQVSFGSVLLPEYWGNCIDYAPYTRVQLALPYIGMVDVDTDDVLGSTNTLTYNIDVLSGALCAMLHCVKGNLTSVIYQWSGSCAVDLPITGANKNAIIGAIGASGVVTSMAFSAAGGGLLGGLAASAALAGSAASAYGTAKGKVQKNGNFGSHAGALGIMTPYFIVSRPVQSVPETWKDDKGYPANISVQLGTVLGYTEVSEINLECSGTEAEKKEIVDLLKKGVLF